MQKVTGIGGFFFRSENPEALCQWYTEHLGVDIGGMPWQQEAGMTVFQPFKKDTDYFKPEKQWMMNFRVSNIALMIEQLEAAHIVVETKEEWNSPEVGKFARIYDPEGNAIELWEPAA